MVFHLEPVRSIAALGTLEPRILATGHGEPLTQDAAQALQALADKLGSATPDRSAVFARQRAFSSY
jgi:hypothetical protein